MVNQLLISRVLYQIGILIKCRLRDRHQSVIIHERSGLTYTSLVTGIDAVRQSHEGQFDIYDLQGRRLNALPRRGIYIVNGRKVIK